MNNLVLETIRILKNFSFFGFDISFLNSGVRGQFLFMSICDKCSKTQLLCLNSNPASHSLTVSRQMIICKFYVPFHFRWALVFCSPICLFWMKNMVQIGRLFWCNNTVSCYLSICYAVYIILRSQKFIWCTRCRN